MIAMTGLPVGLGEMEDLKKMTEAQSELEEAGAPSPALPPPPECTCSATENEECNCSEDCSEEEQMQFCEELLGMCTCIRSDEGLCDCQGYCHTTEDRKQACER